MTHFNSPHTIYGSSFSGRDSIRIISLGGIGSVTKNMFVYEYRVEGRLKDILIVDCGIGFPDSQMYGVDLLIPDVRYLGDKKNKIRGLVFTHGHDDHIGGIPYVFNKIGKPKMWGTKLTSAFANLKLKESKIQEKVQPVTFDTQLSIGVFRVSFVRMTHSIPDASNLVIKTPVGTIYHGSDFKFDFSPLDDKLPEIAKINEVGKSGVRLALIDCLGSERRGFTPSEQIVGETIEKELSHASGKFIFTTTSSNISRIQLAIEKAIASGRSIAFFGRSIDQNVEEALKLGYMRFSREHIIRDRDLTKLPVSKQFLIVAGSQGQPDSALARIANDRHRYVHIAATDTVMFSADAIPGNEEDVEELIEQIYRKGARVSYSGIMEDLHVSGHGSQGDQMLLVSALGADYIWPIGGTYRHMMQFRRLVMELGYDTKHILIPQDGAKIDISRQGECVTAGHVTLENIMIDGLGVGDVRDIVLRDRQTIALEGIVVIVVPVVQATGRLAGEPDIISRGFVYMKESGDLIGRMKHVVRTSMKLKKGRLMNWQFVKKEISEQTAEFVSKETGRYPLIVPVVVEV